MFLPGRRQILPERARCLSAPPRIRKPGPLSQCAGAGGEAQFQRVVSQRELGRAQRRGSPAPVDHRGQSIQGS